MQIAPGRIASDHDTAKSYLEAMKVVYQRVIDRHSRTAGMNPADVVSAREHLRALEILERTIDEHHEMANGRAYPGGKTRPLTFDMATVATLILPDGTRKRIGHHG